MMFQGKTSFIHIDSRSSSVLYYFFALLLVRMCFVSCKDLDSSKKFKSSLNSALADCGGVFWEDVKDSQLQNLLKQMTRTYFSESGRIKTAVTNVGRQPIDNQEHHIPEEDIYVFNENIQVGSGYYSV